MREQDKIYHYENNPDEVFRRFAESFDIKIALANKALGITVERIHKEELNQDIALELAVNICAYIEELCIYNSDKNYQIDPDADQNIDRGVVEKALSEGSRGNYLLIKDHLDRLGRQQRTVKPSSADTWGRKLIALAQALPISGDPIKLPIPSWMDDTIILSEMPEYLGNVDGFN